MNEKLKAAIDNHLKLMFNICGDLSDKQAEEILALRIQHHLHKIDEDEINEWLGISMRYKEQEVDFKVGDKVRRNEKFAKPEIMPCYGMSKNTNYIIEHITPKGKLVLENYIMVVDPEYVELVSEPIIGYYSVTDNGVTPIFLDINDLTNDSMYDCSQIQTLTIDPNSLLNYIKNNNLM